MRLSLSRIVASMCLAVCSAMPVCAWNSISVVTGEGAMAAVQISASSRITFSEEEMIVHYDYGELGIPIEELLSFELLHMEHVLVGVEEHSGELPRLFSFDGSTLELDASVSVPVRLYRTDGLCAVECLPGETVDLSAYGSGLYLAEIAGGFFKFLVR